jgi:hypothetical protein
MVNAGEFEQHHRMDSVERSPPPPASDRATGHIGELEIVETTFT